MQGNLYSWTSFRTTSEGTYHTGMSKLIWLEKQNPIIGRPNANKLHQQSYHAQHTHRKGPMTVTKNAGKYLNACIYLATPNLFSPLLLHTALFILHAGFGPEQKVENENKV